VNKKFLAVLALAAAVGSGAFAQLAIGASGALYDDSFDSAGSIVDRFQSGKDIFWGPFIELGLDKFALGFSANFSKYYEDFGWGTTYDMLNMDYTFYVQGHPLGYKFIIDPFVEAGGGYMAEDYAHEADDLDSSNPLMKTNYFQLGGGLGVNLGALGIFAKFDYLFPGEPATYKLKNGDSFPLDKYPINRMKFMLGAKIIF
jgi:hypothetical protein